MHLVLSIRELRDRIMFNHDVNPSTTVSTEVTLQRIYSPIYAGEQRILLMGGAYTVVEE